MTTRLPTPLASLSDILSLLERSYALRRWLEAEARRVAGVSFAQYLALSLIQESKGRRIVSRIAEAMGRTGQTTTSLIDSLERQGFVRRTRLRQGDRRQVWVAISAKGRELLKAAAAVEPPIGAELTERLATVRDVDLRLKDAVALLDDLSPVGPLAVRPEEGEQQCDDSQGNEATAESQEDEVFTAIHGFGPRPANRASLRMSEVTGHDSGRGS